MRKVRRVDNARTSVTPAGIPRTIRAHALEILTSMPAGKMVPIAAIPLLREDSARVNVTMSIEMQETVELLLNSVTVAVKAYLVPTLAFERFQSEDDVNRAYAGEPPRPGLPVVPFIETMEAPAPGSDPILKYLGKHAREGDDINTAYHETYNMIWNHRAKNRSPDISLRNRLQNDLAPAFWQHSMFAHIVPTFDAAIMEGEVALNVVNSKMPVRGLGITGAIGQGIQQLARDSDGTEKLMAGYIARSPTDDPGNFGGTTKVMVTATNFHGDGNMYPDVFAEMQANGVTVSLSNIDMARKTQAFARLRQKYNQHDDEWIIDMLMDGLSIPEQAWKQPMLLAETQSIFGFAKRYATDGGSLTESVVNGATMVNLNFRAPKCSVGGVIMIVAEALPDQLFERSMDPYLHTTEVEDLPHALRDMLDPEPVESVPNEYIDMDHDTPNGVFGYAPNGYKWNHAHPAIGGRFFRPEVDAPFDEDRQRIWAVETQNPVLSEDFYICRSIHSKPFVDPTMDAFEVAANGMAAITGLTQFGAALVEASDDYEKVLEKAPTERLPKPA